MNALEMTVGELRQKLESYLGGWLSGESARLTAQSIVDNALRKDSRMDPLAAVAADFQKFEAAERPSVKVVSESLAVQMWDLNGAPGVCYLGDLLVAARAVATKAGVGIIGLRNSGGVHELSQYVDGLAEEGFVTLFLWNGGSYTTVPHGSSEPFFGTNPIGFGIPTNQRPITADFATSEIPFRNLMIALKGNENLPAGSGVDAEGNDSIDPRKVYDVDGDDMVRLKPMGGGHKGSAVMLLAEVLTGALVGGVMARSATDDPFTPEEFGGLFICINPAAFGTELTFKRDVQVMADAIRSSRPAPGFETVLLPGDQAYLREAGHGGKLEVPSGLLELLS